MNQIAFTKVGRGGLLRHTKILGQLSTLRTARGSGTGLVTVGPTKVIFRREDKKIISQFCRIGKRL